MSQAPGLRGTPVVGHCSRAATRASCARSSARPTSRTIRARPAITFGDSILHTASMARCASLAVMPFDHSIIRAPCARRALDPASAGRAVTPRAAGRSRSALLLGLLLHLGEAGGCFLHIGGKVRELLHLTNFDDFVVR